MQYALLIYTPDDDVADQAQRPIDPDIAAVLTRPDVTDIATAVARADVVYVCDLNTGAAHVVGGGPVPTATLDAVAREGFVKAVVHDGTKIDSVVHYGRRALPAAVRTAIELGDPPDFDGRRCVDCGNLLALELDHDDPVANGGPTTRSNMKWRCNHCHREKTERDRRAGLLSGAPARAPTSRSP